MNGTGPPCGTCGQPLRPSQGRVTGTVPRPLPDAARAFQRRLKAANKAAPSAGYHLTASEVLEALQEDPDGFREWANHQTHTITVRPDRDG